MASPVCSSWRVHPSALAWCLPWLQWISAPTWSSLCCRMATCFPMVFSLDCRGISAPVHGAPFLPASSFTLVSAGLFHTHFPYNSTAQWFLPFLRCILPEVPPLWLWGSAVPYSGLVGAIWNLMCPTQNSPVFSLQWFFCIPSLSITLPYKPSTSIMTPLATFFKKCRRQRRYICCHYMLGHACLKNINVYSLPCGLEPKNRAVLLFFSQWGQT